MLLRSPGLDHWVFYLTYFQRFQKLNSFHYFAIDQKHNNGPAVSVLQHRVPCCNFFPLSCILNSSQFRQDCFVCQSPYVDLDLRSAAHMENIVSIYKNMDAAFSVSRSQPCSQSHTSDGKDPMTQSLDSTNTVAKFQKAVKEIFPNKQVQNPLCQTENVKALVSGSKRKSGVTKIGQIHYLDSDDDSSGHGGQNVSIPFHMISGSGSMLYIDSGLDVEGDEALRPNVVHVHQRCIEWAPQVYYAGETVMNLELELARGSKLKCSCCGLKGAALGCFVRSCKNTYHVPCASDTSGCRWDDESHQMLCPSHSQVKFPHEKTKKGKKPVKDTTSRSSTIQRYTFPTSCINLC
ncbi:hypothetical protein MKW94_017244, partial [Papaver nudicaule]|nr:hypothetical protein [Papaver nudicaule]